CARAGWRGKRRNARLAPYLGDAFRIAVQRQRAGPDAHHGPQDRSNGHAVRQLEGDRGRHDDAQRGVGYPLCGGGVSEERHGSVGCRLWG
ncbi:hypothetical protein ABTK58_20240, partial [Acinetobacter baumannii]